ncbi:molybdate ABC transporter ATP-binding protein ModF [Gallaecimonas mangrovi]|uniref:molybdate ABC transporter ATP-binding protein ModF n=1 Tax=Gallaecimonas mangrovi TaxID=2291597 RepID=UPI000E207009|nr:molybdate ABC transporter ATP-binding protein ModF [Gallaecimonas mangrovi]
MWSLENAEFYLSEDKTLTVPQLRISPGSCLVITGGNGSGKTVLARAIAGKLKLVKGNRSGPVSDALVSMDEQLLLWDKALKAANTDLVKDGEELVPTGRQLLADFPDALSLATAFGLDHALDRPFTVLSSGEGRKLLLIKALVGNEPILLLDEPFSGLDIQARKVLMQRLTELHQAGTTLVLVVNRRDEIPDFCEQIAKLADCQLNELVSPDQLLGDVKPAADIALPAPPKAPAAVARPLLKVVDLTIRYQGNTIIDGLSWTLAPGQHWQIAGPNGAGKSTLLSVLTGENPQGFSNEVYLFGKRRGSGETLWDIRQSQGLVSPALHGAYRVNCSALDVVLSGFFDSIGLYQNAGDNLRQLARQWLGIIGMANKADHAFLALSYGEQRLLLIARAMVKHPPLLILDEPYQGIDENYRLRINGFLNHLMEKGESQLLLVTHHQDDCPKGITHQLLFVPEGEGWHYQQMPL